MTPIKPSLKPSKSSKVNRAWLHNHLNDPYVKLAQRDGYRARAAYKLQQIDETLHLIKPGQLVVDLGAAPGAWSQYARRKLSSLSLAEAANKAPPGEVIALDLLPMAPLAGVVFVQGDFRDSLVLAQLTQAMAGRLADVVLSDMAPNLSGISAADAARVEELVELALAFAQTHMKPQGALVAKVFQGRAYEPLVQRFGQVFRRVKRIKPKASRDQSAETFLIGLGLLA